MSQLHLMFPQGGSRWKAAVDGALRRATTVTQLLQETLPALPDEVCCSAQVVQGCIAQIVTVMHSNT